MIPEIMGISLNLMRSFHDCGEIAGYKTAGIGDQYA